MELVIHQSPGPGLRGVGPVGYLVRCSRCAWATHYRLNPRQSKLAGRKAQAHFESLGWEVGPPSGLDVCPRCRRERRAEQIQTKREVAEMAKIAPPAKIIDGELVEPPATKEARADVPRQASLDERRLINMKLADCYADGGYSAPWTDQRVADDLGVPRAWVTEIREGFYGPEGSNPLMDQFLSAHAQIERMHSEYQAERKLVLEDIRKKTDALRQRGDDLDGTLRDLKLLAKRVEREIGR